jgi:dUTPase
MVKFHYALISHLAKAPTREEGSVGYDVYAYGDHIVNIDETKIIPVGFHAALEDGYAAFMWDRSSFGAKGIHIYRQMISNPDMVSQIFDVNVFGGVIDYGFRGQWAVILHNFSNKIFPIAHRQRIGQFIIQKCEDLELIELASIDDILAIPSLRGQKGLGCSDNQNNEETAQKAIASAANSEEAFRMKKP